MGTFNVSLKTLTDRVSMEVVYTPRALDEISVEIAEVNRPGLFLAGYYDYFDKLRLQILGLAEMNFLSGLSAEEAKERLIESLTSCSASSLRPSSSAATRNWNPSRRCRSWRRSTRLPCCAPTRPPAL